MAQDANTIRRVALEAIVAERKRQLTKEGFTTEHDDTDNRGGQLAVVAGLYCLSTTFDQYSSIMHRVVNWCWPLSWERSWWKPGRPRARKLIYAGAMILAELERLARTEEQPNA